MFRALGNFFRVVTSLCRTRLHFPIPLHSVQYLQKAANVSSPTAHADLSLRALLLDTIMENASSVS